MERAQRAPSPMSTKLMKVGVALSGKFYRIVCACFLDVILNIPAPHLLKSIADLGYCLALHFLAKKLFFQYQSYPL